MGSMWLGMALIGAGAVVFLAMIVVKIRRDLAQIDVDYADPVSPEQAAAEELAAHQRQIERDRKPAHRNLEADTCAIVRSAVAASRNVNGRRNTRWEPRWWQNRPRKVLEG